MGSEASEGSHGNARVAGTCGGAQCGRAKVVKETPLTESERVAGAHVAERALFVTSRRRKTPTGNTTRGKAKFGKRHGSRKWEEESPSTRRHPRGNGSKGHKTPSLPYNVPHPIGHPQGGLLCITLYSQTLEMHPRPFFGGFLAGGPSQGLSRIRKGIRACVVHMW